MDPFLQLPPPPDDYGYATTLLSAMGALLLVVIGFIAREYLRYRNAQDEKREKRDAELDAKRDKQYADAEALRVEARQRLDALVVGRLDDIERTNANRFAGVDATIKGIQGEIEAVNRDVFRLKEITKSKDK